MIIKIKITNCIDAEFIELSHRLYKDNLELRTKTCLIDESQLLYCLKAYDQNNILVGRLAIFENEKLEHKGEEAWAIGLYECINDINVAIALFHEISLLANRFGILYLIGPMNGSTWQNYRFAQNNESLFFSEEANKDYYIQHFTENGFSEISTYYSAKDNIVKIKNDTSNIETIFTDHGLTIRNIDLNNYEKELESIYQMTIQSFENNFLFSPISFDSFLKKYLPLKSILDDKYVFIAEDSSKNVVGYALCFHDFYNKAEKSLIVKTIARHPDRKWAGLGNVLSNYVIKTAEENGYNSLIHAFMHYNNKSLNISKNNSGNIIKKYNLYAKEINKTNECSSIYSSNDNFAMDIL